MTARSRSRVTVLGLLTMVCMAVGAASASAAVKAACKVPGPGRAACFALIQTNARPRTERQISTAALIPDAAPAGYGYGPSQLQSAYALATAAKNDGGAATVAVVDAYNDPDAASDLSTYRAAWGLPACTVASGCFTVLNENGQTSPLPAESGSTGWATEESLDVDMVSAICPHCKIDLIEADTPSYADLGTGVNSAVAAGAQYVSNSYGGNEFSGETTYDSEYYNHPGDVITASSGDHAYQAGTQYPAASSDVVAVGGTSLTKASNARGWSESVWGTSASEGAGSGCSAYEPKPSWQTDPGCPNRTVADVSAVADPNTGVAAYDSYDEGGWFQVGGTSASSPIIASVYALAGTPTPGTYPASYPYARPSDLFDVTTGSNGTCTTAYLCTGEVGYDGPTGLGTPDGIAAFTQGSPPPPVQNTGAPGISGTPQDGVALHATPGTWTSPSKLTYTYAWEACTTNSSCSPIAKATKSTFTPGAAQVGDTIEVTVTATDTTGDTGTASSQVGPVADPPAPVEKSAPAIKGKMIVGSTLTAATGKWVSPDKLAYGYVWELCSDESGTDCTSTGDTKASFKLTSADTGQYVTLIVDVTDQEQQTGSGSAVTASAVAAKSAG